MPLVNYGFLKSTEIGLIQKSEKDISLGHQQKPSFIRCFHVSLPTTSVRPLSLCENVCLCVCVNMGGWGGMRGGRGERDGKIRHHTLRQSTVISLEEYVCHLPRLLPVLAGLQIVICWRQEFFYIKETVASSTTSQQN